MVTIASKAGLYQRWLRKKFAEIEEEYYSHIDDLEQDLGRIDSKYEDITFTLEEFSFVSQWENGLCSTARVVDIFERMSLRDAARSKITKRLANCMHNHEVLAEIIKPVINSLNSVCVDMMVEYLAMLKKFFNYLHTIDKTQLRLTWVQQSFKKDGGMQVIYDEMTLNQTIKHISSFIDGSAGQRFHLNDQIVVFDEEIGVDDRIVHWLFAPRSYIELIRVLFNVKETLGDEEIVFLKRLIGDTVK